MTALMSQETMISLMSLPKMTPTRLGRTPGLLSGERNGEGCLQSPAAIPPRIAAPLIPKMDDPHSRARRRRRLCSIVDEKVSPEATPATPDLLHRTGQYSQYARYHTRNHQLRTSTRCSGHGSQSGMGDPQHHRPENG